MTRHSSVTNLTIDSGKGEATIVIRRDGWKNGSQFDDLPRDMQEALLWWIDQSDIQRLKQKLMAEGMPVVPTKVVGDEFVIPSKLVGDFDGDE